MNILAIDPGTTQSGWCDFRDGCIINSGVSGNNGLLAYLKQAVGPCALAIEMVASYGMPVGREVFETCVWIGRFQQAWFAPEEVRLVLRKDVKMHLCQSMRAKDTHIWQALQDRFGPPGTKAEPGVLYGVRSHARAALAVAITVYDLNGGKT